MRTKLILTLFAAALAMGGGLAAPDAISPPRAEAASTIVQWGPFTAPAFGQYQQTHFFITWPKPCGDCYITGIQPELVYGDGTIANYNNGPMLHHFVIWNTAKLDATCADVSPTFAALGDRFFASGNERTIMSLPSPYGYYQAANPNWHMNVHIHNPAPVDKTVYIKVTFTHFPGSDPLKDVRPIWLDENNCDTSQYPVCPSGPYPCYDDRHWDWTSGALGASSTVEGTIVGLGGHVHDWGTSVAVEKRVAGLPSGQTGEWLCASSAGYATGSAFQPDAITSPLWPNDAGHPADDVTQSPGDPMYSGHIEEMTGCTPNAQMKPGDTLRIHAQYNADSSIPDVMGIMNAFVYDNCGGVSNPDQHDNDSDLLGDLCDLDADGDGTLNDTDTDDDGDGALDTWETGCGTQPLHGGRKQPERVDSPYAGVDDDADAAVDEALPAGATGFDCDGDGYKGSAENNVFSYLPGPPTNGDQKRCQEYDLTFPGGAAHIRPSKRWPADLAGVNPGNFSYNKINIQDLSSFTTPVRYLGKPVGSNPMDIRFDLNNDNQIGIGDMATMTTGASGYPPMLNGARAFAAPACQT